MAFLLVLGLLFGRAVTGPLQHNLARIISMNAFSGRLPTTRSIELLRVALLLNCSGLGECNQSSMDSENSILDKAREEFVPYTYPMLAVKDSILIPAYQLAPSGWLDLPSEVNVSGVLYGPGTLKTRFFLMAEHDNCWQIAVKAKHDDPPPVILEVWIDREKVDTLSFDRGDQSWGVLSTNVLLSPNLHTLDIMFVNDFLNKETEVDRNAYIESVEITRLESSSCAYD